MSDNLETILRKSLDATERRRIGSLAIGVVMIIAAEAAIFSRLVSEAAVLMLWTGGLTLLVVSAILRATRLILKAIDTLANQKP
jgi:hypothetical protein